MCPLDVCVYRYISMSMWRGRDVDGLLCWDGPRGSPKRGRQLGGCWASWGGAGGTTLLPTRWRDRQLHLFSSPFLFRPRRMSGSPSGRSWLWAVSSTMARDFTPAAARAASRASPPGKPGGLAARNLFGGWKAWDASSGTSWDLPFRGALSFCLQPYSWIFLFWNSALRSKGNSCLLCK